MNNYFDTLIKEGKKCLRVFVWVVVFLSMLDFFGFMCWALSRQLPIDNFYLGTITAHFINFII